MASRQECSICMDYFKDPKLLPCHHSYCYKCLEDYVRENLSNGQFNCPLCRKTVALPAGGVSDFQANFYIESDQGEKFPCDICGPKSVACSRCLDCEENLCQSCCFVHEKLKATRHHKISDLGTLEPDMKSRIRQRIFCDDHRDEEIKLVCQDCKALICFICKVDSHDQHAIKSVSAAANELKNSLQLKIKDCSENMRRLTESKRETEALDNKINEVERKEIKSLEDQRLLLIKIIDEEVTKMKGKIQNMYAILRKQNDAIRRDLMEQMTSFSNANDNAREIFDQGTDIDIIKKCADQEQLFSMAMRESVPRHMTRMEKDLFSPVRINAKNVISLIGTMRDSTEISLKEKAKKEREERERKEKDLREKQEKEEKEKSEREKKQILAFLSYHGITWQALAPFWSDEKIIQLMCPKCQGWKMHETFGFNCTCGGANQTEGC